MTPEEYIKRLMEVSEKKLGLLEDMLNITKAQAESINEDGLESLEKLVNEKQTKIDAIDKLDEEFDVYFRRLKSELKVKSLDELSGLNIKGVKELQQTVGRIMGLIGDISGIEKQNNDKAKSLLGKFGDEIKTINQGKKMNSAYMPGPVKPPSYFIDKKK